MLLSKNVLLTSKEAAVVLGFSHDYIRRLILDGKIKAEKMGGTWVIKVQAIKGVKRQRMKNKRSRTLEAINDSAKIVSQAVETLKKFNEIVDSDKIVEVIESLNLALDKLSSAM